MGTPPVGAGRSRAHPAYEWDRPTRTPTARIALNDPVPRRRQRRPEHPVGGLHVQERGRGVEVVNCCFAPVEALFCGVGGIPPGLWEARTNCRVPDGQPLLRTPPPE